MIIIKDCLIAFDENNAFNIVMFGTPTEETAPNCTLLDAFGGILELGEIDGLQTTDGRNIEVGCYLADITIHFSKGPSTPDGPGEWDSDLDITNIRQVYTNYTTGNYAPNLTAAFVHGSHVKAHEVVNGESCEISFREPLRKMLQLVKEGRPLKCSDVLAGTDFFNERTLDTLDRLVYNGKLPRVVGREALLEASEVKNYITLAKYKLETALHIEEQIALLTKEGRLRNSVHEAGIRWVLWHALRSLLIVGARVQGRNITYPMHGRTTINPRDKGLLQDLVEGYNYSVAYDYTREIKPRKSNYTT